MITISLCMIVKNEEETIKACLDSVHHIVDEINIVDTGSQDQTTNICHAFTDRIFAFEWTDHFAEARNYAFEQATKDYILWLDADDVLEEQDAAKLLELKHSLSPDVDSVSMVYHYAFDAYGNVTLRFRRNRLVKRSAGFRWHSAVHEYLAVHGHTHHADIAVTHKRKKVSMSGRNLHIYENHIAKGSCLTPRDLYYYANELRDNGKWEKAVDTYQAFLHTNECWVEDAIGACSKMADCLDHLGRPAQALEAAWKSLEYDTPRANFCCRMGRHFMQKNDFAKAVYWYNLALEVRCTDTMGFVEEAYMTWVPHIQLCICHYYLDDFERSNEHNEQAAVYCPSDPHVLHNRQLLIRRLKGGE